MLFIVTDLSLVIYLCFTSILSFASDTDVNTAMPVSESASGFHRAISPAEKSLDALINMTDNQEGFVWFALSTPFRDKTKDRVFRPFFSAALIDAWKKAEEKSVLRLCSGTYTDEICGIDINPFTCTQDNNNGNYEYKTITQNKTESYISFKWTNIANKIATFRMIQLKNRWVIDGVSCEGHLKFNMP